MSHYNYLKCLNGVPIQPITVRLKDTAPRELGITWMKFDTEVIRPVDIKATLENGNVALDVSRRDAFDAEMDLGTVRRTAIKTTRASGITKLKALGLTDGELKTLFREKVTDAELGL